MCLKRPTNFNNLEFDSFKFVNIFGLNDRSDGIVDFLDQLNLMKTYDFDIDGAIKIKTSHQNSFSVFTLKNLLSRLNFEFEWILYKMQTYISIHQIRKHRRSDQAGGIFVDSFIFHLLIFNFRPSLSMNYESIEAFCV